MSRPRKSIRIKIFFYFTLSAIISSFFTLIVLVGFNAAVFGSYNTSLIWLNENVEYIPLLLIISVVIFILVLGLLFYFMTQSSIDYLKQISLEVHKISEGQGQLDIKIPIKSTDELGSLAQDINCMSYKLNKAFEEERNAENVKNELINNVSHDLRTPLTSIIGYLDLISKKKYADDEELIKYADIAHNKALTINKLVGQFFEYSKLISKSQEINFKIINLVEVVNQLLVDFIPQFRNLNMEYRLTIIKKPIIISADSELIVRLFENIIGNALKFGRQGKYVDIEITSSDFMASVKISDYGEAISEDEVEKIFERLYRLDKSRTASETGAGLGLSIAKSIAKTHKGDLRLKLQDNKKTFEILLPLSNS